MIYVGGACQCYVIPVCRGDLMNAPIQTSIQLLGGRGEVGSNKARVRPGKTRYWKHVLKGQGHLAFFLLLVTEGGMS